jgi:glycosyltransferase involved in cell wall biosynthesis
VIATTASVPAPLREYVLSFAAGDAAALSGLLARAAADPADMTRLGAAARPAARALTWARTAESTADVYRSVLAS